MGESVRGLEGLRIILDTNTLFRPRLLAQARDSGRPVVLPAVALAERIRQLERDGRHIERFKAMVQAAGIVIEPFDLDEAERVPEGARDDRLWLRHARDALIAAHLRPGDELWTTNPRDFEALGVPKSRLRAW